MKLLIALFFALNINAASAGQDTGGGDTCEMRIQDIRNDIKSWIQKGGSNNLVLPANIKARYSQNMLTEIAQAKVRCVAHGDQGYPVNVNGTAKVCRFDKYPGSASQITCDYDKFLSTDESDQYVLVHHEYAGIAGIEPPTGEVSNYNVSNQLMGYLENKIVKRLAIHPASSSPNISKNFSEFLDSLHNKTYYRLVSPDLPPPKKYFDYHIQRGWGNQIILTNVAIPHPNNFYYEDAPENMTMTCNEKVKKCTYKQTITNSKWVIGSKTYGPTDDPKCKNGVIYFGPINFTFEIYLLPNGDFYIGENTSVTLVNQATDAYNPRECQPGVYTLNYPQVKFIMAKE